MKEKERSDGEEEKKVGGLGKNPLVFVPGNVSLGRLFTRFSNWEVVEDSLAEFGPRGEGGRAMLSPIKSGKPPPSTPQAKNPGIRESPKNKIRKQQRNRAGYQVLWPPRSRKLSIWRRVEGDDEGRVLCIPTERQVRGAREADIMGFKRELVQRAKVSLLVVFDDSWLSIIPIDKGAGNLEIVRSSWVCPHVPAPRLFRGVFRSFLSLGPACLKSKKCRSMGFD